MNARFIFIIYLFQIVYSIKSEILQRNMAGRGAKLRDTKAVYREHGDPEFLGVMENITVPAGRPVRISCSVKNLGSYKVAWMHFEQSAILAVHSHVITRNPRITVSHENHRTWNLHISDVKEEDGGTYMCQINTATAKTQLGYLNVVVPPDIEDSLSSSDVITREGSNITLSCKATGSPEPTIKWRRDDGSDINLNKTYSVNEFEGRTLELTRISRLDMGAYLCIASNGVPPSVSKRIRVSVDFPPMLWIPHQLVGAPIGFNVTLECFTEAHPNSLNYWTREDGQMIYEGKKYHIQSRSLEVPYKTQMMLTIIRLRPQDFGTYKCVAKNPRGETDGTIRLYDTQIEFNAVDNRTSSESSNSKVEKGSKIQSTFNSLEKFFNKEREEFGKVNKRNFEKNNGLRIYDHNTSHLYHYVLIVALYTSWPNC
ncbi:lachesin-like isoform X2 [Rhodnius prolixus]|uniref:lachesin-like isoform X2 n=1 Tax=Rhodnius prolixus TaxID=13249 RepID=UPI003D18F5E9